MRDNLKYTYFPVNKRWSIQDIIIDNHDTAYITFNDLVQDHSGLWRWLDG